MVPLYDISALPNYAKACRKVSSFIRENKSLHLYFKNLSFNIKKHIFATLFFENKKTNHTMKKLLIMIGAALLMAACGSDRNYQIFSGNTQGTSYHIIVASPSSNVETKIQEILDRVDSTLSIFNPDSQISKINRNEDLTTNIDISSCIRIASTAAYISNGAYDITVAPLVDLWGFGPSGKPTCEPTQQQIDSVLEFVGHQGVRINYKRIFKDDPRTQIDLSSVAKGRTVDMICTMLDIEGMEHYLVEIGGEVKCKGISSKDRFWRVGIDNPNYLKDPAASQTIMELDLPSEMAVATSGNYRNYYTTESGQRISHTIDARTGKPRTTNILSATVIHPSCAVADAMATMIMAYGETDEAKLKPLFARMGDLASVIIIYSDENGKTQFIKSKNADNYIRK